MLSGALWWLSGEQTGSVGRNQETRLMTALVTQKGWWGLDRTGGREGEGHT